MLVKYLPLEKPIWLQCSQLEFCYFSKDTRLLKAVQTVNKTFWSVLVSILISKVTGGIKERKGKKAPKYSGKSAPQSKEYQNETSA